MTRPIRPIAAALLALAVLLVARTPATADTAGEISASAREALRNLYATTPAARALGDRARGVLVFPSIVKGGFIFGAEFGNGALFRGGRTAGYYNTTGISYGFQAGLQQYGYALFFMNDSALRYLNQSQGFDLSAGPSITIMDQGMASRFSTNQIVGDIYAFVFNQMGLMGGLSLQGTKITRIHPQ